MGGEVLVALVQQALSPGRKHVLFSWQGGEPTLAGLGFFQTAVTLMRQHGRAGQTVTNTLQTNGVRLDREWVTFLAKYAFLVGVSIDGPRDLHERNRPGSFLDAVAGAQLCREHGIGVNALCVVSRASEGRAREIYGFLRAQKFSHIQFIPCVEPGKSPGSLSPFSVRPEAWGDFLLDLFEVWRADRGRVSVRLFDDLTALADTGDAPACELSHNCRRYLVVEANGEVYPCDFFVRPAQRLGSLLTTELDELFAGARACSFGAQRKRVPAGCAGCPHWRVCRGGCLKHRSVGGGLDRPSTLCQGWKRFLDYAWPFFQGQANPVTTIPSTIRRESHEAP